METSHKHNERCERRFRNHPVMEGARNLMSEAWNRREEPGIQDRVLEILELTLDQLEADTTSTANQRDRIGAAGTGWVSHREHYQDDQRVIWTARSPDQIALQEGMEPFLSSLTPEERMHLMMAHSEGLTERQIADATNKSRTAARYHLKKAEAKLRELLTTAFLPKEENA